MVNFLKTGITLNQLCSTPFTVFQNWKMPESILFSTDQKVLLRTIGIFWVRLRNSKTSMLQWDSTRLAFNQVEVRAKSFPSGLSTVFHLWICGTWTSVAFIHFKPMRVIWRNVPKKLWVCFTQCTGLFVNLKAAGVCENRFCMTVWKKLVRVLVKCADGNAQTGLLRRA